MSQQLSIAMQYYYSFQLFPRRSTHFCVDLSSAHPAVNFRALDWEDAIETDVSSLEALLQDEIDPDVVLGADIVNMVD